MTVPVSYFRLLVAAPALFLGGSLSTVVAAATAPTAEVARYGYEVVHAYPHDPAAFTQGLVFHDGALFEGTGLNGRSTLRRVELASGEVLQQSSLPAECFGEGIAILEGRIFQLTWRNGKAFARDLRTFAGEQEFTYEGEGWGLTTDGKELIMSDGTNRIRFIDPVTFQTVRTIEVFYRGRPLIYVNELEYIKGEIYANVWQTDVIVRIDPATGGLLGLVDFAGLLAAGDRGPATDVLNGIAYDAATDRLFVTGKNWPKLFEVRLRPK